MRPTDAPADSQLLRRRVLGVLAATSLLGACGGPSVLRQAGLTSVPADGQPREVPVPALRIGDTWRYVMRDAMTGLTNDRAELRVTAIDAGGHALAEISQAAGTFVALRVDLAIDWRDTDDASTWGNSLETFWYAPAVRNAVFHHRSDFPEGRLESNNSATELESYRVGA
jgi:hypothetical protein